MSKETSAISEVLGGVTTLFDGSERTSAARVKGVALEHGESVSRAGLRYSRSLVRIVFLVDEILLKRVFYTYGQIILEATQSSHILHPQSLCSLFGFHRLSFG